MIFFQNKKKERVIKMTRINVGIPPQSLTRQHLIAEHREIKRIPNAIKSGRFNLNGQPTTFTLGKGHVKFFYTRLGYLLKRYRALYAECLARGYNVTDYSGAWDGIDSDYMGDYTPTERDIEIIKQRIKEKTNAH